MSHACYIHIEKTFITTIMVYGSQERPLAIIMIDSLCRSTLFITKYTAGQLLHNLLATENKIPIKR